MAEAGHYLTVQSDSGFSNGCRNPSEWRMSSLNFVEGSDCICQRTVDVVNISLAGHWEMSSTNHSFLWIRSETLQIRPRTHSCGNLHCSRPLLPLAWQHCSGGYRSFKAGGMLRKQRGAFSFINFFQIGACSGAAGRHTHTCETFLRVQHSGTHTVCKYDVLFLRSMRGGWLWKSLSSVLITQNRALEVHVQWRRSPVVVQKKGVGLKLGVGCLAFVPACSSACSQRWWRVRPASPWAGRTSYLVAVVPAWLSVSRGLQTSFLFRQA